MSLQQDQLDKSAYGSTRETEAVSGDDDAEQTASENPKCRRNWVRIFGLAALTVVLVIVVAGAVVVQVQKSIQIKTAAEAGDLSGPKIVVPQQAKESTGSADNSGDATKDNTDNEANPIPVVAALHPIEPALERAHEVLEYSQANIRDYTATIIKQDRKPNGELGQEEMMFVKIRNRKLDDEGNVKVPFAVYIKYLMPKAIAGREVIWEENANDGRLIAHEPGILNLFRFPLHPEGAIAMRGQRYPIYEIGLENLASQLIKRGEKEMADPDCDVQFIKGATIGDRACTVIQVSHKDEKPEHDFQKALIFIDDERQILLRYAAYLWPAKDGKESPIDEEYTYKDVKLNVGLTEADFDPNNPEYNYP